MAASRFSPKHGPPTPQWGEELPLDPDWDPSRYGRAVLRQRVRLGGHDYTFCATIPSVDGVVAPISRTAGTSSLKPPQPVSAVALSLHGHWPEIQGLNSSDANRVLMEYWAVPDNRPAWGPGPEVPSRDVERLGHLRPLLGIWDLLAHWQAAHPDGTTRLFQRITQAVDRDAGGLHFPLTPEAAALLRTLAWGREADKADQQRALQSSDRAIRLAVLSRLGMSPTADAPGAARQARSGVSR